MASPESPQPEILYGPPTRYDFMYNAMVETVGSKAIFGWYCHEGGDLLADTLERENLSIDQLKTDEDDEISSRLYHMANDVVYEHEGSICDYCQDDDEQDEPNDFLDDVLLAWDPGSQTAEELAERAVLLAGDTPPNPWQRILDMIDHDPRLQEPGTEK